jgi:hypothetical protein
LRVLVGSVAAVAVAQSQDAGRHHPQGAGTALALAERRPAQLPFWTQAEGAAKRSGAATRPGNEVFALLGRTGTGQCLVAATGIALSTAGVFGFALSSGSAARNLAGPGFGGPGRHLDRRLSSKACRRSTPVRAPLPVRLRRSLRLRAPSPSASGRSAADAPGLSKHHVALRGERRCRRNASRLQSGTPTACDHLGPDLGPPSSPDAITSWSPRIAPMI